MLMLMMIILTVRWWWKTTDGGGWLTFRKEKGNDGFGWSPASLQDVDVMMIMIEGKLILGILR